MDIERNGRYRRLSTSSTHSAHAQASDNDNVSGDQPAMQASHRNDEASSLQSAALSSAGNTEAPRGVHETGPSNELHAVLMPAFKFIKRFIPIVILLAAKVLFEHRIGILLSISMYLVFVYADKCARDMVARRNTTRRHVLMQTLGLWFILTSSAIGVYWVFAEEQLERSLIMLAPAGEQLTEFWSTLFVCVVTDFTLMYVSVFVKTTINAFTPTCTRQRGHWFELVERCALVYRELPNAACWLRYLSHVGYDLFTIALAVIYVIMKLEQIYVRFSELYGCIRRARTGTAYGYPASHKEVTDAGGICPICHDDLCEPIKLSRCAHLFCDECITTWFDRERSCPMCRTPIAEKPDWRDGSTCGRVHAW